VASQFANRLALIGFATITVRGLLAGSDFQGTIQAALLALAVFFAVGFVIGELARRVVEEAVDLEIARKFAASAPAPQATRQA
jgi:hypothetical protein